MGATPPVALAAVAENLAKTLENDGVNGVVLAGVGPQCTRAVGGLAHYIEGAGIPTVVIS